MKVLFAGLGSIGRRHLRLLRSHDIECDVIAFRSGAGSSETPEGVAEFFDLETALAQGPDVAFVTNPPHRHLDVAIECAEADCDLFVEKPLSHTLDRVETLVEIVERRGLVTQMGCNLRFHPVVRSIRSLVDDAEVGTVRSYRCSVGSYLPDWRSGTDYRSSYSARSETGGGVVLDLIHELDYARWLFGDVVGIDAFVDRISDLEIETEDVAEITLKHSSGALGSIHLDYYRRTPRRTVEIVGSDGTIAGDLRAGEVTVRSPDGADGRTFETGEDESYRRQLDYFIEHVGANEPCANDVSEGVKTLRLAVAAKAASEPLAEPGEYV